MWWPFLAWLWWLAEKEKSFLYSPNCRSFVLHFLWGIVPVSQSSRCATGSLLCLPSMVTHYLCLFYIRCVIFANRITKKKGAETGVFAPCSQNLQKPALKLYWFLPWEEGQNKALEDLFCLLITECAISSKAGNSWACPPFHLSRPLSKGCSSRNFSWPC